MSRRRRRQSKLLSLSPQLSGQCESDAIRKILVDVRHIRGAEFELVLNSKMSRGQMINLLSEQANALPLYVGGIEGHPPPGRLFFAFSAASCLEAGFRWSAVCYALSEHQEDSSYCAAFVGVGAIPYSERAEVPAGAVVAAFVDDVWILAMIAVEFCVFVDVVRKVPIFENVFLFSINSFHHLFKSANCLSSHPAPFRAKQVRVNTRSATSTTNTAGALTSSANV